MILCAPIRLHPGRTITRAPIHTSPHISNGVFVFVSGSVPIGTSGFANECTPPQKENILAHQQSVMNGQGTIVRTEVFTYADIVTHPEMLAIADICSLLHIDRCAALCKQMLGTAITEPVCHFAQYGDSGLGQLTSKGVIDYQPKCSHYICSNCYTFHTT